MNGLEAFVELFSTGWRGKGVVAAADRKLGDLRRIFLRLARRRLDKTWLPGRGARGPRARGVSVLSRVHTVQYGEREGELVCSKVWSNECQTSPTLSLSFPNPPFFARPHPFFLGNSHMLLAMESPTFSPWNETFRSKKVHSRTQIPKYLSMSIEVTFSIWRRRLWAAKRFSNKILLSG